MTTEPERVRIPVNFFGEDGRRLVEQAKQERTYRHGDTPYTDVIVSDLGTTDDERPGWSLWGVPQRSDAS